MYPKKKKTSRSLENELETLQEPPKLKKVGNQHPAGSKTELG